MRIKINKNKTLSTNIQILLFTLLLITILLRLIHLNFEDYWFDEINSFWLSDPTISDKNTYIQRYLDTGQPDQISFYFFLKYFFKVFGYNDIIGRYFSFIFGCLAIPIIVYSSYNIKNNSSFLFLFFLMSINSYLIAYSQEVRVYSLLLFVSSINIFLFMKLIGKINQKSEWYLYLSFCFSSVLSISLHIFAFLILISEIVFLFYLNYINKSARSKLIMTILISFCIALLLNYEFIFSKYNTNTWIPPIDSGFFIDFFFSRFFGSKIMGFIYLVTFIYLIVKFRHLILYKNKNLLFLFILIFCTYLIPIVYSLIVRPILIDRYIIFVLVPLFILLTHLIWNLKEKKIKYFLIFLLSFSTVTNTLIELNFKKAEKPQFTELINNIDNSISKNITFNTNMDTEFIMLSNYFLKKKSFQEKNLKIIKFNQINEITKVWVVCYTPLNTLNCSTKFSNFKEFKSIKNKSFHLTELFFLSKK